MNASPSLATTLLEQLQGPGLQQIAARLGMDEGRTRDAVASALPLLLGGLGRNAAQPQGADALLGALQRDHAVAGGDLGGLLGAVLGGAGSRQTDGAAILGHIFGGGAPQATSGLGQATGLDSGKAGQLLQLLAPIVLAFLAQRFAGGTQGDAAALGQALGSERASAQRDGGIGALLGSVLDRDGNGRLGLGDLLDRGGTSQRR